MHSGLAHCVYPISSDFEKRSTGMEQPQKEHNYNIKNAENIQQKRHETGDQ